MKNNKLISLIIVATFIAVSGCASEHKQESTGQYVDSSVITTKVKAALLADDQIHSLPITVKTYKNTVQLSGFVNTHAEKMRAEEVALSVPGVQSVQDALIVK